MVVFFSPVKPLLGKYLLCVMISGGVSEGVRLNMSLSGWSDGAEEERREALPRVRRAGAKAQQGHEQGPGREPFSCVGDRRVGVIH